MSSIGGDVISTLTEKAGISTDQAKQVLPIASETLQSGLASEVATGNVSGILDMFNSKGSALANNDLFGNLKNMFLQKIMEKMGLPPAVASLVAGSGLENIIGGLSNKIGGGGEVTQDNLMSSLGLGGGDAMDAVKNIAKGKLGDIAGGLFG
jgi:hypothetical protein